MKTTVKDPVCGMEIEPMQAAAETTYQGNTYYFCSHECKERFDRDPEKYTEQMQQPEHRH